MCLKQTVSQTRQTKHTDGHLTHTFTSFTEPGTNIKSFTLLCHKLYVYLIQILL